MNAYEELQDIACKDGVEVIDGYPFNSDNISGLYCDNVIAISSHLSNSTEKACVLAEELGHHYTAVGNIIEQSSEENRKQELHGRIVAYNKMVGLHGLIDAYENHCQSLSDSADYLGVTEEFLNDCLEYYKNKYGTHTTLNNYVIFFEPAVAVLELI